MRRRKFDFRDEVTNELVKEVYSLLRTERVEMKEIDKLLGKLLPLCWDPGAVVCFRLLCLRISTVNREYAYVWTTAFGKKWGSKKSNRA